MQPAPLNLNESSMKWKPATTHLLSVWSCKTVLACAEEASRCVSERKVLANRRPI